MADRLATHTDKVATTFPRCIFCLAPVDERRLDSVHHYWTEERECFDAGPGGTWIRPGTVATVIPMALAP